MRLDEFAGPDGLYKFPDQVSLRDNFGELKPSTSSFGIRNGGYDALNNRAAPQGIGNVESTWWIFKEETDRSIGPKKDAALSMAGWRKSRLFARVWDERQDRRWCWARVNNVRSNENVAGRPHEKQQISANFQVADPGWNGGQKKIFCNDGHSLNEGWRAEGALYLNQGLTANSGLHVNGPKLKVQATDGGSYTIRNGGTRTAKATVKVAALEDLWRFGGTWRFGDGHYFGGGVAPVSAITITMKTGGRPVASWFWGGTLQPGEELVVDATLSSVKVIGEGGTRNAYDPFQRLKGSGFIEVPPGEHTITITAGMGPRGARLIVNFWDSFFSS